jgi:hypothetical protein
MKYDVFMRTRTFDRDYDWVNKPDYMSTAGFGVCKSIIALCENPAFNDLSPDDWNSNFYYLRLDGCCVLARVAKTQYHANDNQSIISFEGVAVRPENEMRLFHNIPNIINELLPPAKSFRARLEEEGVMPHEFSVNAVLDPFDGLNIPAEAHPDAKGNAAFASLYKFTAHAEKPLGFIFGKNAKAFSASISKEELGVFYVFDYDSPDPVSVNENRFKENYKAISCEYKPPVPTGEDKVAIKLLVQETGESSYRYRWEAKPWDGSGVADSHKSRYISAYFSIGDRVELAKLELQKEALKRFLLDKGWNKQQYGLRFERDTFTREGTK